MPKLYIEGNHRINGEINVQGAKNSVLPLLSATVLCSGTSVIKNCPQLSDVEASLKILRHLGCICEFEGNTVTVNADNVNNYDIPEELMREMRSSVMFLGAILGRMKKAIICSPGGCELGPRPIDIHISAIKQLGATVSEGHGFLEFNAEKGLEGREITLSFPSVGATENIILSAATAKGTTIIRNAAKEPEISDLADFLNSAGARIYGGGSDTVIIHGVKRLYGAEHTVIPDRIAAVTYMAAAAVTGGEITLKNVMPSHFVSISSAFEEAGCKIEPIGKSLKLWAPNRLKRVPTVRTLVYPGFPTDAGPILIAALSKAKGTSVFVENIFENRYRYVDELNRLGARIKTEGRVAVVEGVENLSAAKCRCTDLRGGAALVVAALSASGTTEIDQIEHIKRGYENISENLRKLGAVAYEE
ncbi:MAG: UDP-N-acetylglucosamine 1-carboxyvinyltransferase [Clostridia bacterium]|nr:UDP-N-acetylglucosamine 1-carboxyvinyltransferase [Clostridia bacterium]